MGEGKVMYWSHASVCGTTPPATASRLRREARPSARPLLVHTTSSSRPPSPPASSRPADENMRAGLVGALLAVPVLGAPSHGPDALHEGWGQGQAIFPATMPAPARSASSSTSAGFAKGVNGTMARYTFADEHDAVAFAAWAEVRFHRVSPGRVTCCSAGLMDPLGAIRTPGRTSGISHLRTPTCSFLKRRPCPRARNIPGRSPYPPLPPLLRPTIPSPFQNSPTSTRPTTPRIAAYTRSRRSWTPWRSRRPSS
jgi:hypothetical protein